MKNILFVFSMPHGSYFGGVASMINSYFEHADLFYSHAVKLELFDYIAPAFCEKQPSKIRNVIYGFLQRRALINMLTREHASGVHIHTSRQFLYLKDIWLAMSIKKKCNIPVYVTIHVGTAETVFSKIAIFEKQTLRWINRYIDKVIFLSNSIRKEFEVRGMLSEKGTILGNFHDLTPLPENYRLPNNSKLHLLFVGAIHRDKGIIELLTALTACSGMDYHLDLCGDLTDPSIKEEFDRLVSALGDHITLHGYIMGIEKSALFHRADALVLPSYHEGMPLVVLEALASGCALIATQVGAIPEILTDEHALWVSPGDVIELKNAIETIYKDRQLLNDMKTANSEKSKNYSLDFHIKQLCDLYDMK